MICNHCHQKFQIKNGIIDLLNNQSQEIIQEIKGNKKAAQERQKKYNHEWLISLPEQDIYTAESAFNEENLYYIFNKYHFSNQKKILDLGAGTTWTSAFMASKGAEVTAVDISSDMYVGLSSSDVLMKHNNCYYERIIADMANLPFQDESFDAVITNSSFHHSSKPQQTLNEMARTAGKGVSVFLISEPVKSFFNRSRTHSQHIRDSYHWNENWYHLIEYKKMAKKAGLLTESIFPASLNKRIDQLKKIQVKSKDKLKIKAAKKFIFLWNYQIIRMIFKKIIFIPTQFIIGLLLILEGKKE